LAWRKLSIRKATILYSASFVIGMLNCLKTRTTSTLVQSVEGLDLSRERNEFLRKIGGMHGEGKTYLYDIRIKKVAHGG